MKHSLERLCPPFLCTFRSLVCLIQALRPRSWGLAGIVLGCVLSHASADPLTLSPKAPVNPPSTESLTTRSSVSSAENPPTTIDSSSAPASDSATPAGVPAAQGAPVVVTRTPSTPALKPDNRQNQVVESTTDDEVPVDLWDRIRNGFALQEPANDSLVARHEAWFAARPDYVERTMERSRMYLYFIVEEVQKRGMPMEIALLPIVESAFNPHALSRSQASGIWQFIPSTGRLFGLQQNWWYDGRKDVVAATTSALDYLQRLHDEFGTWELALAGYNCGEGKIRREIAFNKARNRPTDYLSLNLPDETRNYVPKLLAAKAIVLHPDQFGLILPPIPDEPYFSAVTTHQRLGTKVAAQLAEMNPEDFLMLNPGFNRPIISLDFNQEKTILVPVSVAARFVQRLEDPAVQLTIWKPHRLQRGEALEQVASQYGLTGAELKQVNGIANTKKVAGGGVILVPDHLASTHASTDPPLSELDGVPEAQIPAPAPVTSGSKRGSKHGPKQAGSGSASPGHSAQTLSSGHKRSPRSHTATKKPANPAHQPHASAKSTHSHGRHHHPHQSAQP